MLFKKSAVAAALMFAAAGSVSAAGLDYNYAELGYNWYTLNTDVAGAEHLDADGFNLAGSYQVHENVFVRAGYEDLEVENTVDTKRYNLGVGYRTALNDKIDFNAGVDYLRADIESNDDDGYRLFVGFRAKPTDMLELSAELDRDRYNDAADHLDMFKAKATFNVVENLAIYVGYDVSISESSLRNANLGVRYSW